MTEPTYNATCPFCGVDALAGTVEELVADVPLRADGYTATEGNYHEADVTYIKCQACGEEVEAHHYKHHVEDACDCVATLNSQDDPEDEVTPEKREQIVEWWEGGRIELVGIQGDAKGLPFCCSVPAESFLLGITARDIQRVLKEKGVI